MSSVFTVINQHAVEGAASNGAGAIDPCSTKYIEGNVLLRTGNDAIQRAMANLLYPIKSHIDRTL